MSKRKILIIDYEPRSVEKLRVTLQGAGHDVEVAHDGLAGIEAFRDLRPDLTLIEAMLPKKHGFEVCQELKKTPHGKRTPILIITSVYKGRKYRSQALHHYGCNEYIEKPIADEQLVAVVNRFLDVSDPDAPARGSEERASAATPEPAAPSEVAGEAETTEAEIVEAIDRRIPDHGDKVISFDPDRSRKRRSGSTREEPRASAARNPAPDVAGSGGTAAERAKLEPIAAEKTAVSPSSDLDPDADSVSAPEAPSGSVPPWIWVGLAVLVILSGAVALVVLLG